MISSAITPEEYINEVPDERKDAILELRNVILKNLPEGFEEGISYGMLGYYVPHSIYPNGYHCNTKLPLPYMSFASQKNSINFYHMGIYADESLFNWFVNEYTKFSKKKLDIGKSCMRFKKPEDIPYELIGELMRKISVSEYIAFYEATFKNTKKSK